MPKTITLQERPFRVVRISEKLREAIKATRDARGTTNKAIIESAVAGHLDQVVAAMKTIGFEPDSPRRAARYEIQDQVQNELRKACEAVNIPATQLLAICLRRETAKSVKATEATPKARRKRRQKAEAGKTAPRRKTRRRKATKKN